MFRRAYHQLIGAVDYADLLLLYLTCNDDINAGICCLGNIYKMSLWKIIVGMRIFYRDILYSGVKCALLNGVTLIDALFYLYRLNSYT